MGINHENLYCVSPIERILCIIQESQKQSHELMTVKVLYDTLISIGAIRAAKLLRDGATSQILNNPVQCSKNSSNGEVHYKEQKSENSQMTNNDSENYLLSLETSLHV